MWPGVAALADLDRALAGPRRLPGGPRWTDPAAWHITLAFLGEVAESRVDRAVAGVGPVAAAGRPVRLRLAGAGTFPARGVPRVLWTGVTGADRPAGDPSTGSVPAGEVAAGELARLAREVRAAALAAGIPVERRPYQPHLTLGRWRPADPVDRAVVEPLTGYAGPPFEAAEIVLVRSHGGAAPRYEHLRAWPLGSTQ
ncbi:MAG TPA: 2'-5' RNA ligase family protein [Mycobacteriales bacterium]|nr:2'-5' RNA ligase family protein [Mycobacteriales bacterium]